MSGNDSRWNVNTVQHVGRIDFPNPMTELIAAISFSLNYKKPEVLMPSELICIVETVSELVHEIERLQTDNIELNDECNMLHNRANADSANYISPGNWGGYT